MYFFFNGDPNLQLYLPLDGHLRDYSKNGLNGSIAGTNGTIEVSFEKKLAHARGAKLNYKFNAYTSNYPKYIDIGTSNSLDISGNQISCIFWINDYNPAGGQYHLVNIFGRTNPSGSPYFQYLFAIEYGVLRFYSSTGGSYHYVASTFNIVDTVISHNYCCAITFNRPWVRFYINGKLVDIKSFDYSIDSRNNWQTIVGYIAYGTLATNYGIVGQLNDIYLFSRCLSPQEISQYYQWATGVAKRKYTFETIQPNFFPFF